MPNPRLHPTDLGLILSYRCQSACAHCLYNCGLAWDEWMTPADVEQALDALLLWDPPPQVHVTGGEPFLNFPLLLHAVKASVGRGLLTYAETNAGWCVRESLVTQRFAQLRDAGMQFILISCSPFHAETIPPARTLLAIRAAVEVFGSEGTIVYLPEWLAQINSFGPDRTTRLDEYVEAFGIENAGRLFWEGYGLISGGRSGYRLGHLTDLRPPATFRGQNCRREILHAHHSHFDLYGNYISWFCGGLSVGSWKNLPSVLESFAAGRYPPLIEVLLGQGPYGLFELAEEKYGYKLGTQGFAGKCHLCVDIRRHLLSLEDFDELKPREFYERA